LTQLRGGQGLTPDCRAVIRSYPFLLTPCYARLIREPADRDPIALQCIPSAAEIAADDGGVPDPFGDRRAMPAPGVVHRFPDRVLLVATTRCAVRCRHCTRKNILSGLPSLEEPENLDGALAYIRSHHEIREVLVSGGDPLLLETAVVDRMLARLRRIPHVEVLRLGTRVPVVLPMRVDDELAAALAMHRPLWVNTHFNHPRELTREAVAACERFVARGIPVSNQAVLLRGVNDDPATMRRLCAALQRNSIRPYYVFQCDPVRGVGHFRVDPERAARIEQHLLATLGGLAVPRFVVDVPGKPAKMPLRDVMGGAA